MINAKHSLDDSMSKIASMKKQIELLEEQDSSSEEETDFTEELGVYETSFPEPKLLSVADSFANDDTEIDFSESELSSGDEEEPEHLKYVYKWSVEFLVQV